MRTKPASLAKLRKSKLLVSVGLVLAVHLLAFAAQLVLFLILPPWPPSHAIRHFPFNVIDTLSGSVLFPYLYFRRAMPYTLFLVFGAEVCLVYALLKLAQFARTRKRGQPQ